jgi:hypothetical protein
VILAVDPVHPLHSTDAPRGEHGMGGQLLPGEGSDSDAGGRGGPLVPITEQTANN